MARAPGRRPRPRDRARRRRATSSSATAISRAFASTPTMRRLDCAPSTPAWTGSAVLIGKVIPSISVMRGYEALHAAARRLAWGVGRDHGAERVGQVDARARAACAADGRSSPTTCSRSRDAGRRVRAHPGTPHMNLAAEPSRCHHLETLGEHPRRPRAASGGWRPSDARRVLVRAPAVPARARRGAARSTIESLPPSPLPLAPYMLGLSS